MRKRFHGGGGRAGRMGIPATATRPAWLGWPGGLSMPGNPPALLAQGGLKGVHSPASVGFSAAFAFQMGLLRSAGSSLTMSSGKICQKDLSIAPSW